MPNGWWVVLFMFANNFIMLSFGAFIINAEMKTFVKVVIERERNSKTRRGCVKSFESVNETMGSTTGKYKTSEQQLGQRQSNYFLVFFSFSLFLSPFLFRSLSLQFLKTQRCGSHQ